MSRNFRSFSYFSFRIIEIASSCGIIWFYLFGFFLSHFFVYKPQVSSYTEEYNLPSVIPSYSGIRHSYVAELDEEGNEKESHLPQVDNAPSLSFTRKIWWDSLLSLYLSPSTDRLQNLTVTQRESASMSITSDLRFLFRASNYWFSFFHIPTFFGNFFDPGRRNRIQPSLVLAMLAMSTFWQSSEVGYGEAGRTRALRFRDEAQAAMDASFNAGWIDETLAQTAWVGITHIDHNCLCSNTPFYSFLLSLKYAPTRAIPRNVRLRLWSCSTISSEVFP
jgi:hypothetical protein